MKIRVTPSACFCCKICMTNRNDTETNLMFIVQNTISHHIPGIYWQMETPVGVLNFVSFFFPEKENLVLIFT